MISQKNKELLKKQHYEIIGKNEHSAVQICRWTKKSIRDEGVCYKEKFYGIKSHRCCQMTPCLFCSNKCLHCWRAIEYFGIKDIEKNQKFDSAKEIIEECIKAQRKLLQGFKILPETRDITLSKANMEKYREAQEPMHFAISLSGEPTIYPYIGELILEIRKRGKTSFLVTNGIYPEKLKELIEKKQFPTQLYISVNAPNKKLFEKISQSSDKNSWKKLNESLDLISKIKNKTRTIFRMNLIRELNMFDELIPEYAELIKKSNPLFVEIKGYMAVGFARNRLNYDKMPTLEEMKIFSEKLIKELGKDWKILNYHEYSRAFVIGKKQDKRKLRINEV